MSVEAILDERKNTHGDFTDNARVAQELKAIVDTGSSKLTPVMREGLHMIMHKVARILNGDPTHPDHWDDIGGYSKLVRDRL